MAYGEKHGRGWRARWRDKDGKLRSASGFATRREAEEYGGKRERFRFEPDWCIAPAVTLGEWISDNGLSIPMLSVIPGGQPRRDETAGILVGVMSREPLTPHHAEVLARATQIPARIWLALEHNYRAGLAAGLKDVT